MSESDSHDDETADRTRVRRRMVRGAADPAVEVTEPVAEDGESTPAPRARSRRRPAAANPFAIDPTPDPEVAAEEGVQDAAATDEGAEDAGVEPSPLEGDADGEAVAADARDPDAGDDAVEDEAAQDGVAEDGVASDDDVDAEAAQDEAAADEGAAAEDEGEPGDGWLRDDVAGDQPPAETAPTGPEDAVEGDPVGIDDVGARAAAEAGAGSDAPAAADGTEDDEQAPRRRRRRGGRGRRGRGGAEDRDADADDPQGAAPAADDAAAVDAAGIDDAPVADAATDHVEVPVDDRVADAAPAADEAGEEAPTGRRRSRGRGRGRGRDRAEPAAIAEEGDAADDGVDEDEVPSDDTVRADDTASHGDAADDGAADDGAADGDAADGDAADDGAADDGAADEGADPTAADEDAEASASGSADDDDDEDGRAGGRRRRRGRRGRGRRAGKGGGSDAPDDDSDDDAPAERPSTGSTRLSARSQRAPGGRRRIPTVSPETRRVMAESPPKKMLVTVGAERTQIAVLEERTLVEHYVTQASEASYVGNIYKGRVQNVLPGMEAAFVDIGKGRNGVLYAGEVNYDEADRDGGLPRIEQALKPGQTVMVQVTKDPMGTKGARLTQHLSLAGRYCVLAPGDDMLGISRKLPDDQRERLRKILKTLKPEGFGLIVRTAAETATAEQLEADVNRLIERWQKVEEKAAAAKVLEPVYAEPSLVLRVIRDVFGPEHTKLVIDDAELAEQVKDYLAEVSPEHVAKVEVHEGRAADGSGARLFDAYEVTVQIRRALEKKVWLKSGGYLIIEKTEAMWVIDVNTGKFVGKDNLEETVLRNNIEAAEEIARQLRLRDMGGIIVIDFVDMIVPANRDEVLKRFKRELARDKTKSRVMEISKLGLVQMTRKNVSKGLMESFTEETDDVIPGRRIVEDLLA